MFSIITAADVDSVIARSKKVYRFELSSGASVRSEESFWQAAIDTFPLNPPKSEPGRVLEALRDSLFGGLLDQPDAEVDVLWTYADRVSRNMLRFGVEFFQSVAVDVDPGERAKFGDARGVTLRLFLVCGNRVVRGDLDRALHALK